MHFTMVPLQEVGLFRHVSRLETAKHRECFVVQIKDAATELRLIREELAASESPDSLPVIMGQEFSALCFRRRLLRYSDDRIRLLKDTTPNLGK